MLNKEGTWASEDNLMRKGVYIKNEEQERFLLNLNQYLLAKEIDEYEDFEIEYPFIFVLGLPRSGTTLLTQLLCDSLDIGWIDNIIARFWLAPLHGIELSKILLSKSKQSEFQSDFGKSSNLSDPHEFAYFWWYWFKMEKEEDFYPQNKKEEAIDWSSFKKTMSNIQHKFKRPVIMKNMLGANYFEKITSILEKVIWIYIERDPKDIALSLLKGRMRYYGDPNTWLSVYPPEYEMLKNLPWQEQIAGQTFYLTKFYHNQLNTAKKEGVIKVTYKELCESPASIIEKVTQRVLQLYDLKLEKTAEPPQNFKFSTYEHEYARNKELLDALDKYFSLGESE